MKPTLLIFVAALAAGCARPAYVVKSDAEKAHMKGTVMQLSERLYDTPESRTASPDTLRMTLRTITGVYYNRAGNITLEEVFRGAERTPVSRVEYSYDPSGERMEHSVSRDLVRHTFSSTDYGYDSSGRLITQSNPLRPGHTEYTYDRRGYPETESIYPQKDTLWLKVRHRHDRFGQLRRSKTVKGSGPTIKLRYHPNGVVARVLTGKSNVDLYNERGNLTSMTSIVTETKTNKKGKPRTSGRYPVTIIAEYEYDPQGNWTRRVRRWQQDVFDVAVREIVYY